MGYQKRSFGLRPVNSNKNVVYLTGSLTTTSLIQPWATTVNNATLTVQDEVERGSSLKAVYVTLDMCGLAATGILQVTTVYLMKNPGDNLTPPQPRTEGTSNEKKFIFKTWNYMTMRNQDGNPPYHWEGWVKIPKRYQRMGADDQFVIVSRNNSATGHISSSFIYKWYK